MASEACCSAGDPVTVEYTPKGAREKVGDMEVYVTGSGAAGVIAIYDIFGFDYPQIFQACDRIASEGGLVVAAPDTFRGKAWEMGRLPPKTPEDAAAFQAWLRDVANWELVKLDVYVAVELLRSKGCTKFGILGFCWGAAMSLQAAADAGTFAASGAAHPSYFGREKQLAAAAEGPMCVLSSKGDPLEDVRDAVAGQPWAGRCIWKRYDDQEHGWCAARGDWSNPTVARAASEAYSILAGFFNKELAPYAA